MEKVSFKINGRSFTIACKAGEEDYVLNLAEQLDRRAAAFNKEGEPISDLQVLLMVSLSLLDELSEKQPALPSEEIMAGLKDVATRMEKLANASNNG